MAERSNAEKNHKTTAQDVSTLQKRGRRRLVGAIALVLLAVIVLPMVFDPEPRQDAPTVSIRIPNEEGSKFTPKVAPKPAAPQVESAAPPPQPAPPAEAATPPKPAATAKEAPKAEAKPAPNASAVPAEKPTAKPAEKPVAKPAPAADAAAVEKKAPPATKPADKATSAAAPDSAGAGEQFVVQVGAFADPEKIKERVQQIKAAKLAYYTEPVATANGTVTRIRLGPYASKDAAEKAHARAKALGFNPSNPIAK